MIKSPNWLKKVAAYHCQACKDHGDKTVWITLFFGLMVQLAMYTLERMIYGESFSHAGDIIFAACLFYYQLVVVNVCAIRNIKDE